MAQDALRSSMLELPMRILMATGEKKVAVRNRATPIESGLLARRAALRTRRPAARLLPGAESEPSPPFLFIVPRGWPSLEEPLP
jgi:hypothetical protein